MTTRGSLIGDAVTPVSGVDVAFSITSPIAGLAAKMPTAVSAPAEVSICDAPVAVLSVAERTPLAWSHDGDSLAAVGGNGSVFVFTFTGEAYRMSKLLTAHRHIVKALLFHPKDSNILVSAGIEGIYVWDINAQSLIQVISPRTAKELNIAPSLLTANGAHESDVESLAWAFQGSSLISGGKDANIKVWDTSRKGNWRLLETITGHKAPVTCLKPHEESQRLASAGRDASIKLWDISTLAVEWRARRADDNGITCNLLGTLEAHGDILTLAWMPDGRRIISGSRDNSIKLWDSSTFSEVREIFDKKLGQNGKHHSDVCRLVLPPRSSKNMISCSVDGTVRLWRLNDDGSAGVGEDSAAVENTASKVDEGGVGLAGLAGLDTGAPIEATINTSGWDETTQALLRDILGTSGATTTKAAKASGIDSCLTTQHLVEQDAGIVELELNPTKPIVAIASSAHSFSLLALRLDTVPWLERQYDGTLPAKSLPAGFSLDPLVKVQAFHGHTAAINGVHILPDDKTVFSASSDYSSARFEIATMERSALFRTNSSVHCLAVAQTAACSSPLLFAGCSDYIIRVYSSVNADYEPLRAAYASLAVPSPPLPHDYELARYAGHSGCVSALGIDARSRFMASGGRDWSILLWEVSRPTLTVPRIPRDESSITTLSPIARVDGHKGHINALQFSADAAGNLLASAGSDHCVKVWRISSGLTGTSLSLVWEAEGHSSSIAALCWGVGAPELQSMLFTGGWDTNINVWQGATPGRRGVRGPSGSDEIAPVAELKGHSARVTGLSIASAGDLLVSSSADLTARVWRIRDTFVCVAVYNASPSDGLFRSVSAGTNVFVTGSDSGIQVWPLRATGQYTKRFSAPPTREREVTLLLPAALPEALVKPKQQRTAFGGADERDVHSSHENTTPLLSNEQ